MREAAPYCDEFIEFINYSTTVYHAVDYSVKKLEAVGYVQLWENEVCVIV
jgi:aspartyl aminopeptidase